jgi:DNA-binding NtrC family response regulator
MQTGCYEAADKGTLFLDEIGEMEIGLQAKLLRFLQERSFQRVGQSSPIAVDVRIVAATNRDPLEQIRRGLLREDLYYRLNVIPIVAPPLRDRREDIPILARGFLARFVARSNRPSIEFAETALSELMHHRWPGNVRELENLVDRLAILAHGPVIRAEDVRAQLTSCPDPVDEASDTAGRIPDGFVGQDGSRLDELRPIERMEIGAIVRALADSSGNVRETAKKIGLGHATVYRKIKKYNLV